MVLRERVARYLAVIVGGRHDVLQRDGVNPYGGLCEPHFVTEKQAEVADKVLRQLVHGNVAAPVLCLDEVRHILPYGEIPLVRPLGTVFSHPFCERPVLLVKGAEQRFVLRADALVGVAHHFGGHIRITVRNPLVVLGNLRLDVVKCGVHRLCLLALAFCAVALGIPKRPLDGLLAAELCDSPVDCHSSHNGHNSIFLLTCVHVEHGLECRSHTRYFYLVQN